MSFLILGNASNALEARRAFLGKSGLLLSGEAPVPSAFMA